MEYFFYYYKRESTILTHNKLSKSFQNLNIIKGPRSGQAKVIVNVQNNISQQTYF